jgi:hypothetical protein
MSVDSMYSQIQELPDGVRRLIANEFKSMENNSLGKRIALKILKGEELDDPGYTANKSQIDQVLGPIFKKYLKDGEPENNELDATTSPDPTLNESAYEVGELAKGGKSRRRKHKRSRKLRKTRRRR